MYNNVKYELRITKHRPGYREEELFTAKVEVASHELGRTGIPEEVMYEHLLRESRKLLDRNCRPTLENAIKIVKENNMKVIEEK